MRPDRALHHRWVPDPLAIKSVEFDDKLAKAARKIRAEANGRTCGECEAYRTDGWCDKMVTHENEALIVIYPGAVACKHWQAIGTERIRPPMLREIGGRRASRE